MPLVAVCRVPAGNVYLPVFPRPLLSLRRSESCSLTLVTGRQEERRVDDVPESKRGYPPKYSTTGPPPGAKVVAKRY